MRPWGWRRRRSWCWRSERPAVGFHQPVSPLIGRAVDLSQVRGCHGRHGKKLAPSQTKEPRMPTLTKALIATLTLLAATFSATARADSFEGLDIQVVGQGRPVLRTPGLNSAGAVWTETCAALQPGVQCHIVQLPGFAGTPAVKAEPYLEGMRDRLLAYVEARQLKQPVVLGHSLGGALALMMAAQAPQRLDRLVVVDTLPFPAWIRHPSAP